MNTHLLAGTYFSKAGILLATALIRVSDANGRSSIVRALLDQGSVTTLITERLTQRLRLPRTRISVSITGIGEASAVVKTATRISVSSSDGEGPSPSITAIVLRSLTQYVPPRAVGLTELPHLRQLTLADPEPTSARPIDIIIGADLYGAILLPGMRRSDWGDLIAQNSIFGWILSGPLPAASVPATRVQMHHCTVLSEVNQLLKQFWELEEIPSQSHDSPEEIECENHFARHILDLLMGSMSFDSLSKPPLRSISGNPSPPR